MNRSVLEPIIREAVLAGQADIIRGLLLNENQLSLIDCIATQGEITAHRLSLMDNLTIQNASAKLNRLYRSGYISRQSRSAETGGIEFVYRSNP